MEKVPHWVKLRNVAAISEVDLESLWNISFLRGPKSQHGLPPLHTASLIHCTSKRIKPSLQTLQVKLVPDRFQCTQRGLNLHSRHMIHVWLLTAAACILHSLLSLWLLQLVLPFSKPSWEVCCVLVLLSPEEPQRSFLYLCGPWRYKEETKQQLMRNFLTDFFFLEKSNLHIRKNVNHTESQRVFFTHFYAFLLYILMWDTVFHLFSP